MSAYSDTVVVPVVLKGTAKDFPGPFAKTDYAPGEREQFDEVRARLDRPLQVCGIAPLQPQERHDPASYESDLLAVVAQHTERFTTFDGSHGKLLTKYANQIVADAMQEPARQGRLAEVVTTDAAGRTQHEFVGAKSVWLDQYKYPPQISPIYVNGVPQRT